MYLINTPDANMFMQQMSTDTGRRAFLGDKAKFHGSAINHIGFAHNVMTDLVDKLVALAIDPTRSEPERHDAARALAGKTAQVLGRSEAGLRAAAVELEGEGNQLIEQALAPSSDESLNRDMRQWVREQAKEPGGIKTIRDMARSDSDLVAAIYKSRHYLLGLSEETRGNIILDGFKRFAPDGWNKVEQSHAIKELAAKYPALIQQVHLNSYNPAVADQASRRVQI